MALLTALPGMTVVAPGDPNEVTQLLPQMYALNGPSYIRIGRFGETTYEAAEPAVLGRARKLRDGSRFVVLSSGDITPGVLAAADRLTADGITPALYQFHTVKPLDTETLDRLAQEFDTFLVAEESLPTGGLFSAVAMWQTTCAKPPHLRRLGPPDALALGNYDRETLRNRLGYDTEGVETACRRLWHCARLKRLAA
jgi:transketolase